MNLPGRRHDGRGGGAPRELGQKTGEGQTQEGSQDHHYGKKSKEDRGKINLNISLEKKVVIFNVFTSYTAL